MRSIFSLAAGALLASVALAADTVNTIDVFAWPLSASTSQSLAQVSYTYPSLNVTVKSYTSPSLPGNEELVRVGFYRSPSESWSGVATSSLNFGADRQKTLRLHLDGQGEVYHIGFGALPGTAAPSSDAEQLLVEIVKQTPGPQPHLNKPVVVNADGQVDEKEPEKSFFQKCVRSCVVAPYSVSCSLTDTCKGTGGSSLPSCFCNSSWAEMTSRSGLVSMKRFAHNQSWLAHISLAISPLGSRQAPRARILAAG